MEIKAFLRPEWKKMILPLIFILIFMFLIYSSYTIASIGDDYICEYCEFTDIIYDIHNIDQNDTLTINQTVTKIENLSNNFKQDIEKKEIISTYGLIFIGPMMIINPIYPGPCELGDSLLNTDFCVYYTSEESYNCLDDLSEKIEKFSENSPIIMMISFPEYKQLSIFNIVANLIFLFIEGYLISSIILLIYRKLDKLIKK